MSRRRTISEKLAARKKRQQAYVARQCADESIVNVLITPARLERLISLGYLDADQSEDRKAVGRAVEKAIDMIGDDDLPR